MRRACAPRSSDREVERGSRARPSDLVSGFHERASDREDERKRVERAVALNDVTTPEALNWIDDRLKKLGVDRLLNRAGAAEGDIIWIGNFSFEYEPDL